MFMGYAWVAKHFAMPFGATASVEAWHRFGALVAELARRLLFLPVFRYVDDFYAAERFECMRHGMECFVRLVRALLGPSAVSDKKVECGRSLVILGIHVRVFPCLVVWVTWLTHCAML